MRATRNVILAGLLMCSATTAEAVQGGRNSSPAGTLWRASEFVGVPILDPSHITIGAITDVLFNRKGRAQYVVIGVGGFFGLGEKNVAIPFSAVRFTNRMIVPPPNPVTASSTGAPAGSLGADAAGGISPSAAEFDGAGAPQRTVGHPDHGMIDMTADQIRQVPAFHFPG